MVFAHSAPVIERPPELYGWPARTRARPTPAPRDKQPPIRAGSAPTRGAPTLSTAPPRGHREVHPRIAAGEPVRVVTQISEQRRDSSGQVDGSKNTARADRLALRRARTRRRIRTSDGKPKLRPRLAPARERRAAQVLATARPRLATLAAPTSTLPARRAKPSLHLPAVTSRPRPSAAMLAGLSRPIANFRQTERSEPGQQPSRRQDATHPQQHPFAELAPVVSKVFAQSVSREPTQAEGSGPHTAQGRPARQSDQPIVDRSMPAEDPWPALLASDEATEDAAAVALRTWDHLQRLDREQRGTVWSV